jgi:hypothetical protein
MDTDSSGVLMNFFVQNATTKSRNFWNAARLPGESFCLPLPTRASLDFLGMSGSRETNAFTETPLGLMHQLFVVSMLRNEYA